jgi:NAD(P)-dependent dehydrogenase (short-subunit alcohol dehydrogenase family)
VRNSFLTAQTLTQKGVGFAIVHRLASVAPDHIYLLAVRSDNAGKEAILKLRDLGITATLKIIELDITSVDQVRQAVESIDSQHGKLDGTPVSEIFTRCIP